METQCSAGAWRSAWADIDLNQGTAPAKPAEDQKRPGRGKALALLRSVGVSISKRQLVRLLNENHEGFIAEAQDVLRAGLETSPWVAVDDTGARHAGKNGFCTQIGNGWFTWFRTRCSKSRLNFLDLLRAGHTDYVLNEAAYDHMRNQGLPAATIVSTITMIDGAFIAVSDGLPASASRLL